MAAIHHYELIDRWGIFSLIEYELFENLSSAFVFGGSGNEAILITKDDQVYALGTNCSGCLGLGDAQNCLYPIKLDVLCGKGIVDIACGCGPHVLAVTSSGDLYAWGHNGYCQLGNGNTNQLLMPGLCTTNLLEKRVSSIACGSHHSVILTQDGEVFGWGQNNYGQVGSGTTTNQPTPRRISNLSNKCVRLIGCCQASSFAVVESDEVYSWGYNGNGQLGIGNNSNQCSPCRLDALRALFISQIACGFGHVMVLTDEGTLLVWGANSFGQLGNNTKSNALSPIPILRHRGRFIDVGAIHYTNTSAAMTETGTVLAWGLCRGQSVTAPIETRFQTVNDVFACLSNPPVTCKRLALKNHENLTVPESIKLAFNDQATSDVAFLVEGKHIFVHKSILKIRCEHFKSMFNDHWTESQQGVIHISDFSYTVYKAFMEYLYTDRVDLQPDEAIGLLDLANSYCEHQLKQLCERLIKQSISVENALMLYAAAIKYSAPDLEAFCFKFAVNHLTSVTSTESFRVLDEGTLKDFMLKAAKAGAFKY